MQNVILLDRNAVSLIKRFNSTGQSGDSNQSTFINKLRKRDVSWNFISPILAINEGQQGRKESQGEFRETARQESEEVGKFFKLARTDANFFGNNNKLSELTDGFREDKFGVYKEFLERISPLVIQPKSVDKRLKVRTDILNNADSLGVPKSHPVVLCTLGALYGNRASIGILNPRIKGDKSYNSTNDLLIISRICQLQACDVPRSINFIFETMDKHLKDFLKHITGYSGSISGDSSAGTTHFSVTFNADVKLFGNMSEAELIDLKLALTTG